MIVHTTAMYLFVYDMLVNRQIAQSVGLNIIEEWVGYMYGQMWSYKNIPIVIPIDQIKPTMRRGSNKVLGKIYRIEESENSMRLLHSFYGSNAQKLKHRHSSDLFTPQTESVTKIKYETVADICNFTYEVDETFICTVFVANTKNASVRKKMRTYHTRISSGVSEYFKEYLRHTF